jgi:hypothetical protein
MPVRQFAFDVDWSLRRRMPLAEHLSVMTYQHDRPMGLHAC